MWMWSTGINRNIVECKDFNRKSPYVAAFGINRNIVECKDLSEKSGNCTLQVLIETLWNVKNL